MRIARNVLLTTALALGACSCAGQTRPALAIRPAAATTEVSAPAGIETTLPAPSELLAGLTEGARRVSLSELDVFRSGSEFRADLPRNRTIPEAAALEFLPQYSAGEALSELAYALYSFNCSDYEREPQLRLDWQSTPAAGSVYVGLADFDANRWRWFSPGGATLDFGSMAAYLSPGDELIAAVLLTGEQSSKLESLRLGEVYPYALLSLSSQQGTTPQPITLDASASSTPEGELTLFEWDFDGDGSYDASGTESSVEHVYESPGSFSPQLRVSNSAGHSATATASELVLQDRWEHAASFTSHWTSMATIAAAPDGAVYSAGTATRYMTENETFSQLCRWNRHGELEWARIGDTYHRIIEDAALDSEGNLILGGHDFSGGILQKWSPEGELLWQKYVLAVNAEMRILSLCTVGNDIYICGNYEANVGADPDAIVARFDSAGSLVWHYAYDWFEDRGVDIEPHVTAQGVDAVVALIREEKLTAPARTFPLFAAFELDGTYLGDGQLVTTVETRPGALALQHDDQSGLTRFYIACEAGSGPTTTLLLCAVEGTLGGLERSAVFESYWNNSTTTRPEDMLISAEGELLVGGTASGWPALWRASMADGSVLAAEGYALALGSGYVSDMQLRDGRLLYGAYIHRFPGEWQALPASQSSGSNAWMPGSGNVPGETLSVSDDVQTFSEPENLVLDSSLIEYVGLVSYRLAP